MSNHISKEVVTELLNISEMAGNILLEHLTRELVIHTKSDNSPVTDADIEANEFICTELSKLCINIPIVSEENSSDENIKAAKSQEFWLIDPLDGTRDFLKKSKNFAICIAKIKDSRPEFGLIHIPSMKESYYNIGDQAFLLDRYQNITNIQVKQKPTDLHLVSSHRMQHNKLFEEYIKTRQISKISVISSAIKFCYIASGKAQLYPHFLNTMHWDSAAGDAIVHAAGGKVNDLEGNKLRYGNSSDFKNPHFIVSSS